jgi:hypothetical protein
MDDKINVKLHRQVEIHLVRISNILKETNLIVIIYPWYQAHIHIPQVIVLPEDIIVTCNIVNSSN